MKKLFLFLMTSVILISCSKDDDEKISNLNPEEIDLLQIDSDEGSYFVMTGNNTSEILKGNFVTLSGGQLLDQAFYRVINVYTPKGAFNFRVSFPSSMVGNYEDFYYSKHSLNTVRLPLEETKYMKSAYSELDFPSSSFFKSNNVSGSVDLKNIFKYKGDNYSIFGDVYIRVEGQDGYLYDVKGYFWKK